jgi:hypothetical protein
MSKCGFALGLRSQFGEVGLLSLFYKIDHSTQSLDSEALEGRLTTGRIHPFDIHYSIFDIRFFRVSFLIRLAAFQASGGADT